MASSSLLVRQEKASLADPLANDGVLPTDLLTEVLLRVPAKPLCRLRLVCRSWRSLTSDPCFARAHSSRHPLFAGRFYVEDQEKYEHEIHIFDMFGNTVKRMSGLGGDLAVHLSAQADLLCVKRQMKRVEGQDLLLNPATGAVHVLPGRVSGTRCVDATCFLGHVPSTGEYKVLRVLTYCGHDDDEHAYEVITLDAGGSSQNWRAHVTPCPPPPTSVLPYTRYMVIISEVAYFLSSQADSIVMFDLATEEWRPSIVRGPPINVQETETDALFGLNGCLVTAHHKNQQDCSMDLWFLVDVDKGLWTKRYSMHCGPHWENHPSYPPCPLVVLDDGRLVVGSDWACVLRAFDPRTRTWADLAERLDKENPICLYEGNLLCPGLRQSRVTEL